MTTPTGSFVSPNYPNPYDHNAECYWTITVAQGSSILLTFEDFSMENHIQCMYDYVEVSACVFVFFSDQFITDAKLVYAFGGSYYGKDSRIVGRRTAERENNHGPYLGQQIITATHTVGRSQLICKYCKLIRFWLIEKKRL